MADERLVTITYEHTSGLAENRAVNTFALSADQAWTGAKYTAAVAAFEDWLNGPDTNANRLSNYLGGTLSRTVNPIIRFYDISANLAGLPIGSGGVPAGSPVHSTTLTDLAAVAAGPLPEEVAFCVTLRALGWSNQAVEAPDGADPGSAVDRPKQRYSGRNYLGPLNLQVLSGTTSISPAAVFTTCVSQAYTRLAAALDTNNTDLCVWSRSDASLRLVSDIQYDDAFDTQRRRGKAPTVRTTVSV